MTPQEFAKEILSIQNKQRKAASRKEREIYDEKIHQYVYEALVAKYDQRTVKEMPIVSCISLLRKVVNKFASIYVDPPKRTFTGANETQEESLNRFYQDIDADHKMKMANRYFILQNQTFLQLIVKDGVPKLRNFNKHHIDAVEDDIDPEKAKAYAVSNFNNYNYLIESKKQTATGYIDVAHHDKKETSPLTIAQENTKLEEKLSKIRIAVFQGTENYMMDGNGQIVSDVIPLGFMPFIDIARDKDFRFYVDSPEVDVDFCIQFNAEMSAIGQILEMQGFAVGYLIGKEGMQTQNLIVGPNKILNLPIPEDNPTMRPEFGYASPSADISGAIQYVLSIARMYFWAKDIEIKFKEDGSQETHPSGVEKFLSMIDEFKASQVDINTFKKAEAELFELVKKYNAYGSFTGSSYNFGNLENVQLVIEYSKPTVVLTETEKLDIGQKKEAQGYASKIDSVMSIYGYQKREDAIAKLQQIEKDRVEYESISKPVEPIIDDQADPQEIKDEENGEADTNRE